MLPTIDRVVVMQKDGKLTLESLPFQAGDTVQVIVLPHHAQKVDQQEQLRGSVLQYSDPFAPVAVNDWEAMK
ncbi:MAG: hypothetical protein QM703_09460 [Gemmatales bacterium]